MTAAFLLKAPVPGQVKTRLAADLGNDAACAAYNQLVNHQLQQIPSHWNKQIHFTPPEQLKQMQVWLTKNLSFIPQPDGNLGDRQQAAVTHHLPDAVTLIGGDCPYLSHDILLQIESMLLHHDLVAVPAVDGGYVALALKDWHPGLFDSIQWGSDSVMQQLTKNADHLQLTLKTMEPLEDVDTIHEWQRASTTFPELSPETKHQEPPPITPNPRAF